MKKLVKLRLINWHLFSNETVDIENITFLTGANGTGKSTIIDAMQILLLGDTSGRNFNKAANDRTGRTLRGYLRGELGETADGKVMALRPGRFTSYICLEIYDTKKDSYFTLGIVFDSYEDDSEDHHFFYIEDKFLPNNFTNCELTDKSQARPLTYKELSKIVSETYPKNKYEFFDSNTMYQNFIKEKLGGLPQKYFTLFKKAVSFSPITNISNFITEFVCDIDYNIDIEPMQKNIEQYKLLELEAKRIQSKVDALEAIKKAFEDYRNKVDDLALADYVFDRANYESYKQDIEHLQSQIDKKSQRVKEIDERIEQNNNAIDGFKTQKEEYLAKKVGSSNYSLSSSLINRKNSILEKISTLDNNYQSIVSTLKSYIDDYERNIKNIQSRLAIVKLDFLEEDEKETLDEFIDVQNEFAETISTLKESLTTKLTAVSLIEEFQEEMSSYHQYALKVVKKLENSLYNLQNNLTDLDNDISEMNSGRKPFNQNYLEVKEALESALKERHANAKVLTYCDLVDVKSQRWSQAIEAAIFAQKFNFIVDERYYEDASKILARIAREYNFFSVSVIDTQRLIERNFEILDGSVAEEIVTDNEGARAYTNYLLGRVKKCETFAEARDSGNGLLPNCTGYRNFASWYLNVNKARVSFLGTKVDEETKLQKREEYQAIHKKTELYSDLLNYFNVVCALEVLNSSQCKTFASDIGSMKAIDTLDEDVRRIEEELKEGELGEVKDYEDKINAIDDDIEVLEQENNELRVELGGLKSQIEQIKTDLIPNKRASLAFVGEQLQNFDPKKVDEKFEPFFANALENLPLDKIKSDAQIHFVQTQNRLKDAKSKVIDLRSKYVAFYNLSYDATNEESNQDFDDELKNLSEVLLPSYITKIDSAHKKAIKEFKDDFIYKLRTNFETIKSQIDELNLALKEVKFGRDSYRFSVEPNKDYIEYYNMITDDLLLNVGDAEDIYLEKYSSVMTDLFNMISDSTDKTGDVKAQILENVQKFTDYRTYLVFDLLVKRGDNAVESSLARTFKRQSGGETQTPFYISILASFAQLYRCQDNNDSDSIRLVIFDEAFSKMDATRIKEAVGLLRSFGLQAILSTPSEKLRDLSKEVDEVLVAIHDQKRNRSYLDRYEEVKHQ